MLAPCCPAAIAWLVAKLVVNPVKCHGRRSFAHAEQEGLVPAFASPFLTDLDAFTAIVAVRIMVGIVAALNH